MQKRFVTLLPVVRKVKLEVWLLCILSLATAIRLIFFTGLIDGDDSFYCHVANDLLTGKYGIIPSSFWLRFGMFVPIAFFFKTLGVSEMSAAMFPLLCSLASIILIFYFGKLLFDEGVGLISAFLLSIFPLDVVMSTSVFPDVPLAFFMGLSVFSFLRGERSEKRIHSYFWFALSGLIVAVAYLVKETALILALFFLTYIMWRRELKMRYFFVVLGFLIIFSFILLYYHRVTGDFLFPFKTVLVQHTIEGTRLSLPRDVWFYPAHFFVVNPWYEVYGGGVGTTYGGTWCGFYFYVFFVALGYSLLKKRKKSYPLIMWFTALFLFLEFGIISIDPIILVHKDLRFLTILAMPTILVSSNFLSQLLSRRKIFLAVTILLLISSVTFVNYNILREKTRDLREAISYLKTLPEKNILASGVTATYIGFHFQYQRDHTFYMDTIKNMEYMDSLTGIRNSYIIVSGRMDGGVKFPKEVYDPPTNWKLIKVIENPLHHHNTTIYYVGGFYAENLGPPPPTGKWRVGDLVVFSGFLFEDSTPRQGVAVTTKFSFDRTSWTFIGISVTTLDGSWEVQVDAIPKEWAGRTVYFRAEADGDQSSIVSLFVEGDSLGGGFASC